MPHPEFAGNPVLRVVAESPGPNCAAVERGCVIACDPALSLMFARHTNVESLKPGKCEVRRVCHGPRDATPDEQLQAGMYGAAVARLCDWEFTPAKRPWPARLIRRYMP
jgi:hypothetical protein